MPTRYLDSKYYCEIQATGITESGTNVPWYLSEAGNLAELVGLCYRSDGKDFVVCDESGTIIPYDIFYFDRANKKIGLVYRDPAQNAGTGLGTKLYCWVGGEIVVENTRNPNTYKDWVGPSYQYLGNTQVGYLYQILVDHCDSSIAGSCLDSSGNFDGVLYNHGTPEDGVVKKSDKLQSGISHNKWIKKSTFDTLVFASRQEITLMFFIKPDVSNVDSVLFYHEGDYGEKTNFKIYTEPNGEMTIRLPSVKIGEVYPYDIKSVLKAYSTYFPAGTTTLLTIVCGIRDDFKIYANGVLLTPEPLTNVTAATYFKNLADKYISFGVPGATNSFNGLMDEKRLICGALTAKQIADTYNNMNGFSTNATVTVGAAMLGGIVDARIRIRCDAEGIVYNGGKVDARLRVRCDAKGGVTNTGTVDAKIGRISCEARGFVTITGKVDCIFRLRVKMHTGKRYHVKIKSKPLYAGPNHESFGEVLTAIFNCEFREKIPLNILLWSDYQRYVSEGIYGDNEKVISNQSSVGQPYFRHSITIAPKAGFVGSFFQYEIEKTLASDGFFKFFGTDIKYIPKPTLNAEFLSKLGTIDNGWE